MTNLTAGVNELQSDLFHGVSAGLRDDGFSEEDDSLLGTHTTSSDHEEIMVDHSIMGESSHRSDVLLSQIIESGSIVLDSTDSSLTHSVDLLVQLGSMMESEVTSSRDSPSDSSRVPSSNTSHSSVTSMGLFGEMLSSVSLHDSLGSFSLSDSHDVHMIILLEHTVHSDFLFEQSSGEIHLLGHISSIDLDFHDVVLLLSEIQLVHLSSGNHSHHSSILLDSIDFHFNRLVLLVIMFLGVLGESLLLAVHPVLVESSQSVLIQLLSPDSGQGSQSSGSIHISHHSDHSHRRSLNDGHSFHHFLLVQFGSSSVHFSQNVGHSCLESSESSQMTRLG